jgi:hypothetical protein
MNHIIEKNKMMWINKNQVSRKADRSAADPIYLEQVRTGFRTHKPLLNINNDTLDIADKLQSFFHFWCHVDRAALVYHSDLV